MSPRDSPSKIADSMASVAEPAVASSSPKISTVVHGLPLGRASERHENFPENDPLPVNRGFNTQEARRAEFDQGREILAKARTAHECVLDERTIGALYAPATDAVQAPLLFDRRAGSQRSIRSGSARRQRSRRILLVQRSYNPRTKMIGESL